MHQYVVRGVRAAALVSCLFSCAAQDVILETTKDAVKERTHVPKYRFPELRFSPDGHYIVARTDSSIAVLSVQPLAFLFQKEVHAYAYTFSSDSKEMVLLTVPKQAMIPGVTFLGRSSLERWSVADGKLIAAQDAHFRTCESLKLSPDLKLFACIDSKRTMTVFDVISGAAVMKKRDATTYCESCADTNANPVTFEFSPDSHYVIAMPWGDTARAWDIERNGEVRLTAEMKKQYFAGLAFMAPNRVLIRRDRNKGLLVDFPSGKTIAEVNVTGWWLRPSTNPNFVLAFSKENPPRRIAVELNTGRAVISETPTLDVIDRFYVAEKGYGEIALYEIGKGLVSAVPVPELQSSRSKPGLP